MRLVDTGNHVAAHGARLSRVEVVPAYPITPQSPVIEKISRFIDAGEMSCEYIPVESEHSAMAAMIGASAMGVRTFSATASHGLVYMYELLHWASGARLPMVMANVNRALGPGWNIWCDHQDTLSVRDTGWIQFYCASHQEILDTIIQGFRISEDLGVMLPVMVCYDAFVMSHTYMQVELPDQEAVDRFLPPFQSMWRLDVDCPATHGAVIFPSDYEETRFSMYRAMENSREVIRAVADEYGDLTGKYHGGLVDAYGMEDAECALVALGSIASEAKVAVDALRAAGHPCGLVRIRSLRPFPVEELRELLSPLRTALIMDRGVSFGLEGILYSEVKAVLYGLAQGAIFDVITGMGGRDVTYEMMAEYMESALKGRFKQESVWPNVRLNDRHLVSRQRQEEIARKEWAR